MNQEAIHLDPELDQHIKDLIEELKVIMSNDKVIAVFDIGKTNKKILLFDSKLKVVYQS